MSAASDSTSDRIDRAVGALVGLAVGDAVGTTLEFAERDKRPPLTDMIGGGPFGLEPGEWTDDTAMALCLADSLLDMGRLDQRDLMNRFVRWWRTGENSCTGCCFDIGATTRDALERFEQSGHPSSGDTDPLSAGNGSLMRLAPIAVRFHGGRSEAEEAARAQSKTTHAAEEAVEACAFFVHLLLDALDGRSKEDVLRSRRHRPATAIDEIAQGSWRARERSAIRSSGYVVDTLEAAVWSVGNARDFKEAILLAANLADDADTVAAVTGQLAGALWGMSGIPTEWVSRLAWADRIQSKAAALFAA